MGLFLELKENIYGRDFAVGDVHGNFHALIQKLESVAFDPTRDRLICLGDLVDRGEENEEVVSLIDNEVFYSILGNHECLLLAGVEAIGAYQLHIANGGEWFAKLDPYTKHAMKNKLKKLPFAIELPIAGKKIGFVHAEVPRNDWALFKMILSDMNIREVRFDGVNMESDNGTHNMLNHSVWARKLISNVMRKFYINPRVMNFGEISETFIKKYTDYTNGDPSYDNAPHLVHGIDHVYVGHSIVPVKCTFGDYSYIDTGSYLPSGDLTLVNLTETHS